MKIGKRLTAVAGVLMVTAAIGAPSASAATEFGNTCVGAGIAPGTYTLTTNSAPAGGLPLTAPSAGVITKVKVSMGPFPIGFPTSVRVLRSAGGNLYTAINQTTVQTNPGGVTVADARLPVQTGDRLGLHGLPFTYEGSPVDGISIYCEGNGDGSRLGAAIGDVQPGQTAEFGEPAEGRVPLAAVVEADADNDGYGDETQDLCPQSATTQAACPVIVLDAYAIAGKGSATVLISSSTEAPITVSGAVALPKGKASSSAKATLKKVTKKVKPGAIGKFKLKFPGSLKSAITGLAPGKSLTLKITASAKNVAGAVSKDKTKVKLK